MKTKLATLEFIGTKYQGEIQRLTYEKGGAALRMMSYGETIATLTIMVAGYELPMNYAVIKNYSENAGVLDQLVRLGIVRDTGERVQTGWVTSPVVEITAPELRE